MKAVLTRVVHRTAGGVLYELKYRFIASEEEANQAEHYGWHMRGAHGTVDFGAALDDELSFSSHIPHDVIDFEQDLKKAVNSFKSYIQKAMHFEDAPGPEEYEHKLMLSSF